MVETSTIDPPKTRGKRRNLTVEAPPQTPQIDEDELLSPPKQSESSEIAAWPDFGVWKAGGLKSEQKVPPTSGFNYWNTTLNAPQRIFGTWYVYRLWPVMKLQPRGNKFVNPNCAKFSAEDGPMNRDLIYGQLRIGVYLMRLLQRQTSPTGQVCMCEVEIKGSGNFTEEEMPILDVEQVDWEHPSNAEYAKICRSRGILKAPEQKEPSGEGAEEMAATSVLGEIASKAFDKMGNPPPAQTVVQSDIAGGVGTELVGLLREQINVNRPPAQQGTVKEQLEGLVTLAKTMTPPAAAAPDMGPYIELQRQNNELVRELMRKDVERAEHEAAKAREEAAQYRAALPQPKTVDEQWDELERAAKRFDRMTGKKQRDEEDAEEKNPNATAGFWGGLLGSLPAILREGVSLMREVNVGLYNFKLNGSGGPPLNPATGQPGTEPLAPEQDQDPPLSPQDQAKMEAMQNVVNQLSALAQPMLGHLSRGKSGSEFARFVIENYGPPSFETIRNVEGGSATILAMIQQYPPVWNQIGVLNGKPNPQGVMRFQKFLDEFMGYSGIPVQ